MRILSKRAGTGLCGALLFAPVLATSVLAADLSAPRAGQADPPPALHRGFSGFYGGIQAGHAWAHTETTALWGTATGPAEYFSYGQSGVIGGLHFGYNWAERNFLLGMEADLEASGLTGTGQGNHLALHSTTIDRMGSLRARAGFLFGGTLLYATGGLAYGNAKVEQYTTSGLTPYATDEQWKIGWTVGAGVEQAISSRVSLRLEYRYTDLGDLSFYDPSLKMKEVDILTSHGVRAGLSFRF